MNNRRNLKENLTISNKQRFSIRKFSIGVASVMLGTTLYFMGGVGTSIVHADSVQEQPVQTSKLDTNSAQASSDTSSAEQTSSQNQTSSAQNSQKAESNASANTKSTDSKTQTSDQVANATADKKSASQADSASATNSKTQDNKKVVSDANRGKSTANDAQTKSAQQIAKSNAANSNKLVVQQTLKLTGNAKLNKLADSKAQTDTKTDSNYSVTDNYPEGLMNYLPRDFNNTQEYAFEWLRNERKNNIILTTNRTGDGVVHVYQDGKEVDTLARKSPQPLPLYDNIWEDEFGRVYGDEIGTVYNDDYAGIVQSNGLKIIYSSHAKDVDNAGSSYSTVSFFVPHKITQTVTYKDSDGHVIDRLTHTQDGLTGQSYTTGLPSGPKYVRRGEYLDNITNNGSGLMSEFSDGYSCTKDYHDGVSVTFTEHDSEKTGIGTMDYVIYEKSGYDDSKKVVQRGSLADGQSTDYTNSIGIYTIVNPYVQQTTKIVYQYKELGYVVNTDPEGNTTRNQYHNDKKDPTKVEPINVPSIPGYTTLVNGKTVSAKTIIPADLGKDTTITYVANDQSTTAKFVDDDNNGAQVGDTVPLNGKTDQTINTGLKVPDNYELAKGQTLPETYKFKANGNDPIVIHLVHATKPDTNDNELNKTVTRTINVKNPDGTTTTIKQEAHLHRSGTIDKVTQKATYTPWTTDNWAEYDTPQISGYTPSQAKVLATTVDGNTKDLTVTITYSADKQKASVTYMDDKTGKTLKVDNLNGVTNAKSGYTTKAAIDTYTGLGYTLVSDDTNGNEVVFDNDDANDQAFTVHLSHGTITVTPENPGKPGEPVDPDNPDGPKYPAGTDKTGLTDTVNRTITYVMSDGSKAPEAVHDSLSYTASKVIDKVTGEVLETETKWSANQDFKDVDSPSVKGYTPDTKTVSNKNVAHDAADITETVKYSADAQKASVTYMDDKTGKTLKVDNLNGVTNAKSGYTTKAAIDTYTGLGYTLVSDDTNGNEVVFDNDDANDQAFTVHLSHGTITVTPENPGKPGEPVDPDNPDGPKYPAGTDKTGLTDTVNRTITYVMSDGSKAPEAVHDSLSYTASKVIDKVTGEVLETETKWSANQDFKDVDSPSVKGYTPDTKTVSNKNVAHDAADITETVKYSADAQKASVTYMDDKTGKTLKVDNLNGVTNAKSGYTTKAAIDTYTGLGYTLVSDDTNGNEVVFDNDDANDQAFTVHLSHGTITVTPENPGKPGEPVDPDNPDGPKYPAGTDKTGLTDTVNRTITYVMSDGSKAPEAVHDSLSYTASKVIDKVTGEVLETETKWSANQDFKDVDSPSVKGYTPDTKTVSNKNVAHDAADITETVKYSADAQKASVTYMDDKTGKTLKVDNLNGVTNAKSGYTTKAAIDTYTGLGYTLVSDDTNGNEVVFDNDDANDQAFTVHLSHGTITVTPENPGKPGEPVDPDNPDGPKYPAGTDKTGLTDTVNRTITYVMSDGSKAPEAVHDSLSYTASKVIDKVTGEVLETETKWSANQDFKDVDSPSVKGYTPDTKTVSNKNVAHDAADITETVKYSADAQKASVTYMDDKTGKTLKVDNLNGVTNAKSGYTTKAAIDTYTGLGYTLVSDDTNGNEVVFDNDDANDQAFTVHLSHGTITVTPENPGKPGEPVDPDNPDGPKYPAGTDKTGLTDTVNRTITYVMSDGSKAPEAVHDSLSYTASKVIDKVTGEVLETETKWSANQDFKDVDSPSVKGYTPDTKTVSNKNVAHDAADITETVKYSADAQKASVTYMDDKTGKTLKVDNLNGVTNAKSGYTTKAAIDTYTGLGYTLVSDDTNGNEVVFDNDDANDQAFTVHLSHGTITVTPENPGKPGEPVDPDNPDGPKYPAGTDKTGLTDTVNRTITYVMSDGSKAPEAVHDSLSYTASKVIDKVTGEVLETETKWSANQDFKDVDSPSVKGYTPDTKTVSNKNVAHDAADITETVKYSADAQKASVTYMDDKTGKTLKVDNLNGVTNAKSGYTTKAAIDTYTGLGYTLVSDDTNGNEVVFDNDDANDQAFTVHLSHGTITVTPENPGKPGEPVDPDNPDGPKYPAGTDEYQVKRTGTQTIHYVGAGDKTPADNKQTFVFTREITFDDVTGKIISVTPWNVQSHTFGNVDTPVIPGYHADKAVAGGETVTPDDLNKVITVTYAPDGGSGDNPGSNGGGDQGTTPTPDDQPDTTLPSDNNTDKDVEKDKQDKPKKVKKARKIIKTRITKQEHIGNAEKAEPLAEQEHNDQTVASPVKNEANEPQLPQTGEANTSVIGLLGMLVAGFAAILGFESSRSRKHKN